VHLIEFFDRGVLINRNGTAFVGGDGQDRISYAEAFELSHRIAAALNRDGCSQGTSVAVLGPNHPLVFPAILGVIRSGATWVAVNSRSSAADIAELLSVVDTRVLLHSAASIDVADKVREAVPGIECVCFDPPAASGWTNFETWLAPPGTRVPLPPPDPEAVAALFGTGGTTGKPKAVEVPHRAFEAMIHGLNTHMPEPNPVHLVAAPLTHAAGALVFPVLSVGGTNVIHDGVDPGEILASVARNAITRMFLPPTAIYSVLEDPSCGATDTSTLRYFLYGAAPMSVHKLKEALGIFGPVMAQFYGQVEAPMICSFLSPADHEQALTKPGLEGRLASCGRPSTVATVAIMDESGHLVEAGTRGEIVVRSSLVMKSYRGDPAHTAATTRDDWHATGDVGYLDGEGYLYIVDRKRDVVISGGFNVYPSEVEQIIWSHPAVKDCAVIGIPHDKWGEQVTAVVEVTSGAQLDPADLIGMCKQRLGSIKAPKQVIMRELPRSPAGKVLKRALRDEYWSGRDRRI